MPDAQYVNELDTAFFNSFAFWDAARTCPGSLSVPTIFNRESFLCGAFVWVMIVRLTALFGGFRPGQGERGVCFSDTVHGAFHAVTTDDAGK